MTSNETTEGAQSSTAAASGSTVDDTATPAPATMPEVTSTAATPGSAVDSRVRVRMYRQGLGDCFVITLPRQGGKPYIIMIDCGVILGTPDASGIMNRVVQNIIATTGGHVDLLVVTHEHWDHLSGFIQAQELFHPANGSPDPTKLQVDEVWVGWTEDPRDDLANKLRSEHQAMRMALSQAALRMHLAGASDQASEVMGLLEFFGARDSGTTGDALKFVKELSKKPLRFCLPGDAPTEIEGAGARIYVLGPPHDEKLIKRFNPSATTPETFGMAAMDPLLAAMSPLNVQAAGRQSAGSEAPIPLAVTASVTDIDLSAPFDSILEIPIEAARQMPFFQARYWGEDSDAAEARDAPDRDQSWRQIDADWLDCSAFALKLDSATNNTSLALAIELESGEVLLFAADAQVGNWLSWQGLSWTVGSRTVTGPDLLHRSIFYKVGHHGSHNATLREKGLDMMTNLQVAMVPVNHEMALKKRWGNIPLSDLLDHLETSTKSRVLRIDQEVPAALAGQVEADALYYEIALPLS